MGPVRQNATPNEYCIGGVQVQLNNIFDEFWKFCAERQAIYEHRSAGKPAPWTTHDVFQKHKFCNVYRVLDRHCQYLIREVIEKGSQAPEEIAFRVVLFDAFTCISTWERLVDGIGELTWKEWPRQKKEYQTILNRAKSNNESLYTGAFQKPAPRMSHDVAHLNHLEYVEVLMGSDLPEVMKTSKSMVDAFEFIASFPGMGDFNSFQLLLNLSYTPLLNFSGMDFVVLGPGAKSGIGQFFAGRKMPNKLDLDAFVRWMCETQDEHFARLGLMFNGLGPDHIPLQLADVEHTLCEVDKYTRVALPLRSTPAGGKRHMKSGHFRPKDDTYTQKMHLPKAWAHRNRKKVRIRSEPVDVVKRYVVEKIMKERIKDGRKEYHILWFGYPQSDATWESAENMLEDAPDAVQTYEAKRR